MKNKKDLKKKISKLIEIAKEIYPKVKYDILMPGFEGEDATLEFFSPKRYEDKLDDALIPVAVDILVDDGYFIGISTLLDRNLSKN